MKTWYYYIKEIRAFPLDGYWSYEPPHRSRCLPVGSIEAEDMPTESPYEMARAGIEHELRELDESL